MKKVIIMTSSMIVSIVIIFAVCIFYTNYKYKKDMEDRQKYLYDPAPADVVSFASPPVVKMQNSNTDQAVLKFESKLTAEEIKIKTNAIDIIYRDGYKNSTYPKDALMDSAYLMYYSDTLATLQYLAPKGCGGATVYIVDRQNGKLLNTFSHSGHMFFVDKGYFFLDFLDNGEDLEAMSYYKYGSVGKTYINDSILEKGQTYFAANSDMCGTFGKYSTTTNSINIDYYDRNEFINEYDFKKLGEKTFLIK